ncbi:hypothetical protein E0Z10_g857 [Xylaria hypoxylon]|uniref:Uncharacterized protein n=1 Tax=Xylaria hypoxylon TaxID=37992 RepID=A0A4Z0Z6R9_9PEZI|nr:hypothetical protein E0Z10_g857 [Xylaria hypoxylon]
MNSTSIKCSFEQDSSTDSSELGTQPATPELGQSANCSRIEQPTPDTSPESISKQTSARLGSRKGIGLGTTPISSEPRPTGEIKDNTDACSQHPIHNELGEVIRDNTSQYSHHSIYSEASEESSNRSDLPTTPIPYADKKANYFSVSATSIFSSLIRFFNLARQRSSRADDARVQSTINLIKSLPTIRRVRVKNPTRTLTIRQYEQLLLFLRQVEENKLFDNKLRFEYTRSTRQFEIRMTSSLHEGVIWVFLNNFSRWQTQLLESNVPGISDAAGTLRSHGNEAIDFPVPEGPDDTKSPDGGIKHSCHLGCVLPTLVFEVAWTNGTRKELRDKAEAYIVRSNGKIRSVVAVYMGEMVTAERKNEARLKKKYRGGQVDENGHFYCPDDNREYEYEKDEENITGGASILKILDETGNAIQSALLRISLEDCVCGSIISSVKGSKAPLLEISSETFRDAIQMDLKTYRTKRARVLKEAEIKKKTSANKKEKEEEEKDMTEEGLRRAVEARTGEDEGVLGRVMEHGRSFSARVFKRRAVQSNK